MITAPVTSAEQPKLKMEKMPRLPMLDGWRGISILCVLGAHLLPLGPSRFGLNNAAGILGMAIFFTLSGFLITTTLIYHPSVRDFLIRRIFRIVPLAWLFLIIILPAVHAPLRIYAAHFFFYGNLPPFPLLEETAHMWSLGVEMQFYMLIALIFALLGRRGLFLVPVLAIAVTILRVTTHTYASIVTDKRLDEILAGATLALIHADMFGDRIRRFAVGVSPYWLVPLVLLSCHPWAGPLNYLRPYLVATMVGLTVYQPEGGLSRKLNASWLVYLATISYALYVIHPIAMHGWFGPASKMLKYERRLLGIPVVFLLSHLSTKYFESYWIKLGKSLTGSRSAKRAAAADAADSRETATQLNLAG